MADAVASAGKFALLREVVMAGQSRLARLPLRLAAGALRACPTAPATCRLAFPGRGCSRSARRLSLEGRRAPCGWTASA
eukprot:8113150-Alexandrium_andersonii.AAC.1